MCTARSSAFAQIRLQSISMDYRRLTYPFPMPCHTIVKCPRYVSLLQTISPSQALFTLSLVQRIADAASTDGAELHGGILRQCLVDGRRVGIMHRKHVNTSGFAPAPSRGWPQNPLSKYPRSVGCLAPVICILVTIQSYLYFKEAALSPVAPRRPAQP